MATITVKNLCTVCGKGKASFKCDECSQTFCYNHVTEQTNEPRKHSLIEQIDQWELQSIEKIRRIADEARQLLLRQTTDHITKIEDELQQNRKENDFVEPDLNGWKEKLTCLTKELAELPDITIQWDTDPLPKPLVSTTIGMNVRWNEHGKTVAGGNEKGNDLNQLSHAWNLYVDDDETVYIADSRNHRIVAWKCDAMCGEVVAGGNERGNRADQLDGPQGIIVDKNNDCLLICDQNNRRIVRWPRQAGTNGQIIISDINCTRLAMDDDGYLYVSDYQKDEVRQWRLEEDAHDTIVAGGNDTGCLLSQLNCPTTIFVDHEKSVYVSDSSNDRVVKWTKGAREGVIVAGGHGHGDSPAHLSEPHGIVVDEYGTVYVADYGNHRVMRWPEGATQGNIVVGGNGRGAQSNQLDNPTSLAFDRQGNLYVLDNGNYRVQKFSIDPTLDC